jgi:HD-GYP domain-containing protein (c-di-GMP phosphodiesterase class II)
MRTGRFGPVAPSRGEMAVGDSSISTTTLQRILTASRAFTEAVPDHDDLLQSIARQLADATGDACTLRLLTDDGASLTPAASHFHDDGVLRAMRAVMDATQPADTGLWAAVAARGEAVTYTVPPGTTPKEASPEQRAFIATYRPRHVMAVPLRARDHLLGGVALTRFRPEPFAGEEIALIEALAEHAALAADNARLYRVAQRATADADGRARRLQRQVQRIDALHAIDEAIVGSPDLTTMLNVLLDHVVGHLGVDAAQILLYRPTDGSLETGASRGFRTPAVAGARAPLGVDAAGRSATERRVVVSGSGDEPARDPRFDAEGFVVGYAVPLIARGRVIGVLEALHRSPLQTDGDWSAFLAVLAGQASIAIDGAATLADLARSHADLLRSYDATLEGWVRALDLRDHALEGHSQRVTAMAVHLARVVGFGEDELAHVYRGALLHDIGKIAIPDAILHKDGPLSPEEWNVMRRHPDHAHAWLAPIPFLRHALHIPHQHHERWDGKGYPQGLRGEEISPAARLFAVVDVYDALRSVRPYGAALAIEEARAYVKAHAGTHFDPSFVEAFLTVDWEPIVESSVTGIWQ